MLDVWLVTGYEEAVAVLHEKAFSVDHGGKRTPSETPAPAPAGTGSVPGERGMENIMLFKDPPDHTRLRNLVNKAFTPRVVEGLRPRIQSMLDELLADLAGRDEVDLIADFAYPLPVRVISELLRIPEADRADIRNWSTAVAPILDPILPPDVEEQVAEAGMALGEYFEHLITARRSDPGPDLLSALIHAEEEGDQLNADELRATCVLLLIAGHETTMNLIGNGMLALLQDRRQLDRVRDDPALSKTAVEEFLRFDSPVHLTARTALEDVTVAGRPIAAGEMVVVAIAAANRDPRRFSEPERLDVARSPNRHIAFSAGPHFCVGATLARAEAQIAVPGLVRRFPRLDLAVDEPEWRKTITLRGLKSLPVALELIYGALSPNHSFRGTRAASPEKSPVSLMLEAASAIAATATQVSAPPTLTR